MDVILTFNKCDIFNSVVEASSYNLLTFINVKSIVCLNLPIYHVDQSLLYVHNKAKILFIDLISLQPFKLLL